jgi:ATP-dependent DNA helicase RecG
MASRLVVGNNGAFVAEKVSPMKITHRSAYGMTVMGGYFKPVGGRNPILISRVVQGVKESVAESMCNSFNSACGDNAVLLAGRVAIAFDGSSLEMKLADHHVFAPNFRDTYLGLPEGRGIALPIYPLTEGVRQPAMRTAMAELLADYKKSSGAFSSALSYYQLDPDLADQLSGAELNAVALDVALRGVHGDYILPIRHLTALTSGRSAFHKRLELPKMVAALSGQPRFSDEAPQTAVPLRSTLGERGLLGGWMFPPTDAQARVVGEIADQFRSQDVRTRLVQGDVGAGKSAVIATAAAMLLGQGLSTVIAAPTEILANQLAETIARHIGAMCGERAQAQVIRYKTGLSQKGRDALLAKQAKSPLVLVGTHGVAGAPVANLGLAVFDEEQRFSSLVKQQMRNEHPRSHLMLVSATPVPRTLASTLHAGSLVSVIDQRPAGRAPIETSLAVGDHADGVIKAAVLKAIRAGGQVYMVCPAIDSTAMAGVLDVKDRMAEWLKPQGIEVGLAHGEMSSAAADKAIESFKRGETRVLVGTTILAVGVDVPQATLMVVYDPQMMGVAQLHQIRGRVGRGSAPSECIFAPGPAVNEEQLERLAYVASTLDGFELAEFDLSMRGAGDFAGVAQSGGDIDWPWFAKEADVVVGYLEARRDALRREVTIDFGFGQ